MFKRILKRIILGNIDPLTFKQREDSLQFKVFFYYFTSVFFIFISAFSLMYIFSIQPTQVGEVDINGFIENNVYFEGLSGKQINISINLMKQIKPIYLGQQKNITFTKNVSHHGFEGEWNGMNYDRGEIFIKYRWDINGMKTTISHELLHTYDLMNEKTSHDVVRDLARLQPTFKQGVCYG